MSPVVARVKFFAVIQGVELVLRAGKRITQPAGQFADLFLQKKFYAIRPALARSNVLFPVQLGAFERFGSGNAQETGVFAVSNNILQFFVISFNFQSSFFIKNFLRYAQRYLLRPLWLHFSGGWHPKIYRQTYTRAA